MGYTVETLKEGTMAFTTYCTQGRGFPSNLDSQIFHIKARRPTGRALALAQAAKKDFEAISLIATFATFATTG